MKLKDGDLVLIKGRISVYEATGGYQIYVDEMLEDGIGNLYIAFEKLKQDLAKEGLFDSIHKKPIPFLPKTIGVVTSASGAVIRDIIHRVRDRFPSHILLIPTPVQGEGAAEKIAQAIKDFNRLDEKVSQNRKLPVWTGEIYYEKHRGTYTSMARIKRENRRCEFLYSNADYLFPHSSSSYSSK